MKDTILTFSKTRLLPALGKTKNYARAVGVILFAVGLFGFAFRSDNTLSDSYLAICLILGFWGIVAGMWDSNGSN